MSEATTVPRAGTASIGATYLTLVRWTLAQLGPMLPLVIVVQAMLAAGVIIGFGFLMPNLDPSLALRLSTGAPTVLLLVLGLVIVPQGVATARLNGTFTYMRSLPMHRPLMLAADLSVWLLVALPSVAAAVLVAWWYHDVQFSIDWPLLLAGTVLVTVMATATGHAIAVTLPPMLAQLLSQVLVFLVMLFSPINFPAAQLPRWFQVVHDVLPIEAGANLVRAGLAADAFTASPRDVLVLAAWTLVSLGLSIRALTARP